MIYMPKKPFAHVLIQYFAMFIVALTFLTLSGCATDPNLGMTGKSRNDVLGAFGKPTGSFVLPNPPNPPNLPDLPNGERLQYSRQPYGQQVINFDLDAAGKVAKVSQAMTPAQFALVELDVWRTADVQRAFGKPPMVGQVYSFKGDVWSYRYDFYGTNRQFHVFIDPEGVVRRTQSTDEIERLERVF